MKKPLKNQKSRSKSLITSMVVFALIALIFLAETGAALLAAGTGTGKPATKKVEYTDPASGKTITQEWEIPEIFEDGPGDALIRKTDKQKFRVIVHGVLARCPECGRIHGGSVRYDVVPAESKEKSWIKTTDVTCPSCRAREKSKNRNVIMRGLFRLATFVMPNDLQQKVMVFEERVECSLCGRTITTNTFSRYVLALKRPFTDYTTVKKEICDYCKQAKDEKWDVKVGEDAGPEGETAEPSKVTVKEITVYKCKNPACKTEIRRVEKTLEVSAEEAKNYPGGQKIIENFDEYCSYCAKNK